MASTIITKYGSGAPLASDLVRGELAVDTENKRLYTENSGGSVVELGTNPAADVTFADNVKAVFGAGSDFEIYHDASHSFIKDAGTGHLKIQATNLKLQDVDGNNYIDCIDGSYVRLMHNTATKLETTATGIDVTGTVTADGLTVGQSQLPTIILDDVDGTGNRVIDFQAIGVTQNQIASGGSGNLLFSAGGDVSSNEAMRIDSAGHVIAPYGVTLGTAVGTYNADNTLDDYEEGTFTASLRGGTTEPGTLLTTTGYYTKIGRAVTYNISFENKDTTGYSGSVSVSGLPFANGFGRSTAAAGVYSLASWTESVIAVCGSGTSTIDLMDIRSGNSWASATHTAGSTRYLWLSGTYMTTA